jgi:filamentous hemagglutinin family protein
VFANPTGGTVSAGNASISSSGNTLTVNQSTNSAVIDWRGFDINQGETTNFVQPSSNSITLNRVNSPSASTINGALNANGNIVIVNQNGVLFGKNAKVNVNSLVVSTADIDNAQFMAGNYAFNKAGNPNATIQNEGMIRT